MSFLNIVGLNHVSAPVEIREKLSLAGAKHLPALKELHGKTKADEFVLLSTCNRTEFYFSSEQSESLEELYQYVSDISGFEVAECRKFFYEYEDSEAIQHLFRVASGLNSLVVGEAQILGQLKEAFEVSISEDLVQSNFFNIYQNTLQCAKAVRRETEISKGSMSVSFIAVQLAKNIFESLNDKTVLLIGAGEMCELAGVHFRDAGVHTINVANRTLERAQDLANKFGGKAYSLDQLNEAMQKADIVLSCTGSNDYVLRYDFVDKVMTQRNLRSLFLIDIAVPRDIEESINKLSEVYLYNIDDLNKIIEKNRASKDKHISAAERIVETQIKSFEDQQFTSDLGPIIASLKKRMGSIKDQELEKLFKKTGHLTPDDCQKINRTVDLIINKIVHDPIISLRRNVEETRDNKITKIFKDFFNL